MGGITKSTDETKLAKKKKKTSAEVDKTKTTHRAITG